VRSGFYARAKRDTDISEKTPVLDVKIKKTEELTERQL
jgi:hypothetical protein